MKALDPPKVCGCGRVWRVIPKEARFIMTPDDELSGYYWECICKSTLFVPELFSAQELTAKDTNQ